MKLVIILIILAILVGLAIYFLGPVGFKSPKNIEECLDAGGEMNQGPIYAYCRYNFKAYPGPNI